jgi:geranylgeranyl diphosphate synthase, type I
MTIAAGRSLDQVHHLVEPAILELLDRLDPRNRLVAGYQLGFWNADGSPAACGGKGLRPALALLSARAAGAPVEAGLPAAVAVELVHNFSLLHDDVMDGDLERRHRPTAWAVFGIGPAILAGDALITLATAVLADAAHAGASERLDRDVCRLIAGQAADLEFEHRDDVTLEESLSMAADKTGALISCACALGALLCGGPERLVAGLSRFGAHLGLAFQLVDDLLGVWGDPERTGKPVGSDLRAHKKSIPVVAAMTRSSAFAVLYRGARPLTDADIGRATRLIEATGAREWTCREADRETAAALDALEGLDLPDDVRRELTGLALSMIGRDR